MTRLSLPPFTPHPGQRRILQGRKARNVACMGRRFGKTHLLTEVILTLPGGALAGRSGKGHKGLPCAWYAPNDSYFSKVFQAMAHAYTPVIRRATTMPRPVIEFVNGGSIDFWTLENPMKCGRGNFYARVVIDEAAHARHLKDAWEQTIEYTLADLNGDAWFISTPYGMNYFHELWQRGEQGKPDWASFTAPSMDNPHLPAGWMEEKRKTSPERVFAQEVLAQFLADGAGVFRRVHECIDATLPTDPGAARDLGLDAPATSYVIGIDWGRHNDFTALCVIDCKARAVVSIDRFTDVAYHVQLERVKALCARFPKASVVAEVNNMGEPLIEQLRRDGVPVRPFHTNQASKAEAIERLSVAFEQGEIRIPAVDWLVAELVAFDSERSASGAMRYSAPPGQHDDGVMALAIAWANSHPVQVATAAPVQRHAAMFM